MTAIAVGSLVLVSYTYLGYPLLVMLLGALRRFAPTPPAAADPAAPRVSVLVPVWRGERWLDAKLASLLAQDHPAAATEVMVGLDGSGDGSAAIALEWARRDPRVRVLPSAERLGKPATLNRLVAQASGDILVLTDVRPTLSRGAVSALVAALRDARVGCATGALHLSGTHAHGLYWRYEQAIRRAESRFRGMVGATGPLVALRRSDLAPFDERLVSDDLAFPLELARRGLRTTLIEEARAEDVSFADAEERVRKIRNLGGNWQLFWRRPRLLLPLVNPLWFETLSHKALRLLVPFALLLLALDSVRALASNASPFEIAVAGGQLVAYGAATARLGPVGRLARTFVMAQLAVVIGLWRFVTGRVSVLW